MVGPDAYIGVHIGICEIILNHTMHFVRFLRVIVKIGMRFRHKFLKCFSQTFEPSTHLSLGPFEIWKAIPEMPVSICGPRKFHPLPDVVDQRLS
jgi:hypothetical protein